MTKVFNNKESGKIKDDDKINKITKEDKKFTNIDKEDFVDLKKPSEEPDEDEVLVPSGDVLLKVKRRKPPTDKNNKFFAVEDNLNQSKKEFVQQGNKFDKTKNKINIKKGR